jgi:nucleoside-diphosphate-sugar epimerase
VRMLVLGASGFVGTAAAEAASRAGWAVRGAGGRRPARCADAVSVDLTDPTSLRSACRGAAVVVHAAGLAHVTGAAGRDADFEAVNVRGTAAVVQAAAAEGVRRLVLVSSVSVYGEGICPPGGFDETAPCRPTSPYGRSKLAAEGIARDAVAGTGLELVVLRLATVYGPGDPGNLARLMRLIDRGRFLWVGTGENLKTLVHVGDVGRALVAAAPVGAPTGIYNLTAPPVSMASVVAELARTLDRRVPAVRLPAGPCLAAARLLRIFGSRGASVAESLRKWMADDLFNGGRFEQDFGWRPAISLAEGLRGEVAGFRATRSRGPERAPRERAPAA